MVTMLLTEWVNLVGAAGLRWHSAVLWRHGRVWSTSAHVTSVYQRLEQRPTATQARTWRRTIETYTVCDKKIL